MLTHTDTLTAGMGSPVSNTHSGKVGVNQPCMESQMSPGFDILFAHPLKQKKLACLCLSTSFSFLFPHLYNLYSPLFSSYHFRLCLFLPKEMPYTQMCTRDKKPTYPFLNTTSYHLMSLTKREEMKQIKPATEIDK